MQRRLRRWVVVALLVLAAAVALVAAHAPYLLLIHGTTAGELERLAAWLEVRPGMRIGMEGILEVVPWCRRLTFL